MEKSWGGKKFFQFLDRLFKSPLLSRGLRVFENVNKGVETELSPMPESLEQIGLGCEFSMCDVSLLMMWRSFDIFPLTGVSLCDSINPSPK